MSKEALNVLLKHATCRHYVPNKPLTSEEMEQILLAGRQTPTSCNSQLISVVIVEDPALRKKAIELNYNQTFIGDASAFFVICGDLYKGQVAVSRVSDAPVVTHQTAEGLITLCVDAGSVMRSMIAAAHSLGLGTCPIGSVRMEPDKMAQLLELPQKVIPIVGLCVGYMAKVPPVKPRLDMSTFAHVNKYHTEGMEEKIDEYNEVLRAHYLQHGRTPESFGTFSESMKWYLLKDFQPRVKEQYATQGYKF
eukprot:Blabericola_migrator_1__8844@NODE_4677_length_1025_cov_1811_512526_g2908_i0_p1_GENE_NODE_4677_length_1025_cov_1811_512526_g2908_i0NODE_4677_length_1025_cov_1811_512526_g2908_i0_p1_ORF_typecomplete_len250_score55_28Nitroreductase/PF00881_24/2_5e27TM1586_NiRdase/PF14512_6/1_6e14_NODE_4677_length_1025_cov_1811_512526_g2908_i0189938